MEKYTNGYETDMEEGGETHYLHSRFKGRVKEYDSRKDAKYKKVQSE
jgi:hypothetical protein